MKCNTCGKMNCMAHGGEMKAEPAKPKPAKSPGEAVFGLMPKGHKAYMAEGGMPEDAPDMDDMTGVDDELNDMAAGELLDAIEAKDKKGILEAIKALVMNSGGS